MRSELMIITIKVINSDNNPDTNIINMTITKQMIMMMMMMIMMMRDFFPFLSGF